MTKEEVNNYLKDLNNMNIVRNEIRGLRNIISEVSAERDNAFVTLAQKGNALQKANARIAELEQRLKSSQ